MQLLLAATSGRFAFACATRLGTIFCLLSLMQLVPCFSQLMLEDVQVLMSVKQSLVDPQNETSGWDSGFTDPCFWRHVTCSSDRTSVISLELGRLHLSGTIPPEISRLRRLQKLLLLDNNFSGVIPQELSLLSSLNTLDLSNNQLTGQIPSSIGRLQNLNYLHLNNNSLSGTIPVSLASIETLSSVDMSFNNFSGQMPPLSAVNCRAEGNPHLWGLGIGHDCPGQKSSSIDAFVGFRSNGSHVKKTTLIACLAVILPVSIVTIFSVWICRWRRCRQLDSILNAEHHDLHSDVCLSQLQRYSLHELQQATGNFNSNNLLGCGGSGQVYKGRLYDGTVVAVKRFRDPNAVPQFKVELEMISLAAHRNLLRLKGFCTAATELVLVYPFMPNGSVASRLGEKPPLEWAKRKNIALGSARGLVYLHEQCDPKIIHGDVKAANILLDKEDEAMVADFGLAKILDHSVSHVTTVVRGTYGYIAPESLSGQISAKADVYSFGILLLELIAGQTEIGFRRSSGQKLLDWIKRLQEERRLHELIMDGDVNKEACIIEELERMVRVALLCAILPCAERPKMSEVLQMLEGEGVEERWEAWQKCEENRCSAMEQQLQVPPGLEQSDSCTNMMLSGPR